MEYNTEVMYEMRNCQSILCMKEFSAYDHGDVHYY
jgi:hypothetical protein